MAQARPGRPARPRRGPSGMSWLRRTSDGGWCAGRHPRRRGAATRPAPGSVSPSPSASGLERSRVCDLAAALGRALAGLRRLGLCLPGHS
jgi:hypothetical protein